MYGCSKMHLRYTEAIRSTSHVGGHCVCYFMSMIFYFHSCTRSDTIILVLYFFFIFIFNVIFVPYIIELKLLLYNVYTNIWLINVRRISSCQNVCSYALIRTKSRTNFHKLTQFVRTWLHRMHSECILANNFIYKINANSYYFV